MFKKESLIFLLIFVLLSGLVFAGAVLGKVSLGVSPAKVEMKIPQGERGEISLTILNGGETPFTVSPYANDYIKHPDGSVSFFEPGSAEWSCAEWFQFEPAEFEVKPGKEEKIKCLVETPSNARLGQYHAVVFFEAVAGKAEGASISGRVGSVFVIQVVKGEKAILPVFEKKSLFWIILIAILIPVVSFIIAFRDKISEFSLKVRKLRFKRES